MKTHLTKIKNILISTLAFLLISTFAFGQTPQKMSYQAVVRDAENKLVINQSIGMRISIVQGSINGTEVYKEIYNPNPSTNSNGLVTIEIGAGIPIVGSFATIDWSTGIYFIKTETDPTGGTNYSITGTSQLLSVPYALYAKTAGSSIAGPKGEKGDQGKQGEQGLKGDTGLQGPTGKDGADGKTAYQLWLDAGNTGDMTTFIAGNKGAIGDKGLVGDKGLTGDQGPQGIQGDKGLVGDKGATGDQGLVGDKGLIGDQGPQGLQGDKGLVGDKGATGDKGLVGDKGLIGDQGPQGLQGDKGLVGDKGATGDKGSVGDKGLTGDQGSQGIQGDKGLVGDKGATGDNGAPGISIVWKGTLTTAPATPVTNWAYYNSIDKISYIYNGTTWANLAQDGKNGIDGKDGLTTSVNGVTQVGGAITLTKGDLGLGDVDNTTDANKPVSVATQTALATKVDKVTGKGLSTNDYTTAEQTKLATITGTNTGDETTASIKTKLGVTTLSGSNTGDQDLSGLITTTTLTSSLASKVDKVTGKGLSTNDYTTAEQTKLSAITGTNTGDETTASIKTKLGVTTLSGSNTGDQDLSGLATTATVTSSLASKVDKVTGKGLSTNDYTTAEQAKLTAITGTNTGDETTATIKTKLGVTTLSGSNTGDQDLSGLATTATVTSSLASKVDKVTGKGLSTNDYTTAEQTKLSAITGTNTGDETTASIKTKLGVTTLSGSNTGDQDLSGLVTTTALTTALAAKAPITTTVTLDGIQTVTNKTLVSPILTGSTSVDNLSVTGNTFFTGTTTVATPINATDAATKAYVDALKSQIQELQVPLGVTDIEGTHYNAVKIGNQLWMASNLKTATYNDGTAIPNVSIATAWAALTTGAQCDYNNIPANTTTYGKLYNWYAVNTGKLCPSGWHAPSDTELETLSTSLGGDAISGGALKEAGTTHWSAPNTGATNSSGFTGLAGGSRSFDGTFNGIGSSGYWWEFTGYGTGFAKYFNLFLSDTYLNLNSKYSKDGMSVRCLRN